MLRSRSARHSEMGIDAAAARDGHGVDRGFILVSLGLLILPIMIFAALAVDISSWYSRASQLQKAADASALAGVVWMPKLTDAQSNATTVLTQNGIQNGVGDVTLTVGPGLALNSLKVCITDHSAPQYFAAVFASPQAITRCSVAQYNVPLQLGSPLNFFGGNTDLVSYQPGTQPAEAQATVPGVAAFGGGSYRRYCRVYVGASKVGYWDRTDANDNNPNDWVFYNKPDTFSPTTGTANNQIPNCGTGRPTVPDYASFFTKNFCNVRVGSTVVGYWARASSTNTSNWYYRLGSSGTSNPDCGYGGGNASPIPADKSPGMWASVLGPDNSRVNGDIYSTKDGDYRATGYWYSIDVPASGVTGGSISVQIFDASRNCDVVSCRTPMGDDGGVAMQYSVYDSGSTPYDMGDDTLLCSKSIADNAVTGYAGQWYPLCTINSAAPGHRYYVNVKSTSGSGFNGYALRAVAGTYPAACLNRMPAPDVTCYGAINSVQPSVSAYGDMDMYNGIAAGTPTKFFLANVKEVYAGKTLNIRLWDPGDGNGDIFVQVLKPGPAATGTPEAGVPAPSCDWKRTDINGNLASASFKPNQGTASGANGCMIQTTFGGTSPYNGNWADFLIDIPTNYTCDDTVDPTKDSGSCWWQIKYYTTASTSDYTTWSASIVGDPVRLTQ